MIRTKELNFEGYEGLPLHSRVWEPESPRASVLIVHGFGEHGGRYAPVAEEMAASGIAVMAHDNRGHGLSGGRRGLLMEWEEFRGDTDAAAKQLAGLHPTVPMFIFGHSLGGTIALDYILNTNSIPRGAIISAPALGKPGISPVLLAFGKFLTLVAPRMTVHTKLDTESVSRNPEECRLYREVPLVHDFASPKLSSQLGLVQQEIFAQAPHFPCPLLMSYGTADRLAPRKPIEDFFDVAGHSDKDLRIFPDAFHELHNDIIRDEVLKLYIEWILKRAS